MLEKIAGGVGSVAKLAMAVAPAIAALNTEVKYFDYAASSTCYNPGTNDQIVALSGGISNGNTDTTRIGDSILAKNFYMKGNVYFAPSSTIHISTSRMTIFVWKGHAQNDPPTVAKLFEIPSNFYSPINRDYSEQIVVLKDKYFDHNAPIADTNSQGLHSYKLFKKLDWHMRFNGTGATNYTTAHIFACFRGNQPLVGNASAFNYWSRLNFTDT